MKNIKKKVLTLVGVAAFAVAVALNINAGLSNNADMDVALTDTEAMAFLEWAIDWWNSGAWDCRDEDCSLTINLGFASWTTNGITQACVKGGCEVAHCWSCSNCDAPFW